MHFSSVLQWWEQWQLRVLVLGSLCLQFLLLVFCRLRSGRPSFVFRSSVWLAYLAADALAVYALATLFNRHKQGGGGGDMSGVLEVLWAPILLIHLGGQHSMTAYSIEDNELWRRHILTLVSQVTVALYVFGKSWPGGDERLLQAAILLFVVGILRFSQKPLALKRASIASLMSSWAVYPPRERDGKTLEKITRWFFADYITLSSLRDSEAMKVPEEGDLSLQQFVERAKKLVVLSTRVGGGDGDDASDDGSDCEAVAANFRSSINRLFVDQSVPYRQRIGILRFSLGVHRIDRAFQDLAFDIRWAFRLFYTNFKGVGSKYGRLQMLMLPFLTIPPIVLFAKSDKHGYHKVDVKVTYVLLACTCLLEFLLLLAPGGFIIRLRCISSDKVPQHNIISLYARKRSSKLMNLAKFIGIDCEAFISKHRYMEQESESACIDILNLVIDHVKYGWLRYIHDAASYRRFNSLRGQLTMARFHRSRDWQQLHQSTLRALSFDQSIVIWHLATELCLHCTSTRSSSLSTGGIDELSRRRSRIISNYMIYLLCLCPEMLAPGTREGLFMTACNDIELMLKHVDGNNDPKLWDDQGSVARQILRMAKTPLVYPEEKVTLVVRACQLAEDLMELLRDEDERWKVIQGVWVEMLCFSASRCRAYLHAKSMGDGVEFLTYVWLLLSDMGMETFADRFQRLDDEGAEPHDHDILIGQDHISISLEEIE